MLEANLTATARASLTLLVLPAFLEALWAATVLTSAFTGKALYKQHLCASSTGRA